MKEESVKKDLRLWNIDPNMVHNQTQWDNALKTAIKSANANCGNHRKVKQNG